MKFCTFLLLALVGSSVALPFSSLLKSAKNKVANLGSKAVELKGKVSTKVAGLLSRQSEIIDKLQAKIASGSGAIFKNYANLAAKGESALAKIKETVISMAPESIKPQIEAIANQVINKFQEIKAKGDVRMSNAQELLNNALEGVNEKLDVLDDAVAEQLTNFSEKMAVVIDQLPKAEE